MSEIPIPDDDPRPAESSGLLRRLQPFLTLLIAITAIVLATWEGIENRRHNRLTVQPRLDGGIATGSDGTGEYVRMAVESTGLGPAVLGDFRIYFDGDLQGGGPMDGSRWTEILQAVSSEGTQINARAFGRGHYFPTGREYVFFEARRPPGAADGGPPLSDLLDRLAIQVCYCSIYGTDCGEVLLAGGGLEAEACGG